MGELVDIESKLPHLEGDAICLECKCRWRAVCPVGVRVFECPSCHLWKGVWEGVVTPETLWQCECSCTFFRISPTETICAYCGSPQVFD